MTGDAIIAKQQPIDVMQHNTKWKQSKMNYLTQTPCPKVPIITSIREAIKSFPHFLFKLIRQTNEEKQNAVSSIFSVSQW